MPGCRMIFHPDDFWFDRLRFQTYIFLPRSGPVTTVGQANISNVSWIFNEELFKMSRPFCSFKKTCKSPGQGDFSRPIFLVSTINWFRFQTGQNVDPSGIQFLNGSARFIDLQNGWPNKISQKFDDVIDLWIFFLCIWKTKMNLLADHNRLVELRQSYGMKKQNLNNGILLYIEFLAKQLFLAISFESSNVTWYKSFIKVIGN